MVTPDCCRMHFMRRLPILLVHNTNVTIVTFLVLDLRRAKIIRLKMGYQDSRLWLACLLGRKPNPLILVSVEGVLYHKVIFLPLMFPVHHCMTILPSNWAKFVDLCIVRTFQVTNFVGILVSKFVVQFGAFWFFDLEWKKRTATVSGMEACICGVDRSRDTKFDGKNPFACAVSRAFPLYR